MSLPIPTHQFICNNNLIDVGSQAYDPSAIPSQGITYVTYDGKDCIYIETNGSSPSMNIPFSVSNTDTFTLSFWMYVPDTGGWNIPIGLDDGVSPFIEFAATDSGSINPVIGTQSMYLNASMQKTGWVHYTFTYETNTYILYINNEVAITNENEPSFSLTFSPSRINIGGNNPYSWNFGQGSSCVGYIRQLCTFDSALSAEQITQLYTDSQGYTSVGGEIDPRTPIQIETSSTTTSFTVSWSGATDATSYVYTLNGSPVTPSTDNGLSSKTAIFTGLTPDTSYVIIVIADTYESQSKTIRTLPLPAGVTNLGVSNITYKSFVASWVADPGTTSYTYKLNGSSVTPSVQTTTSATFTRLIPTTSYTLIVTSVNIGGQTDSAPVALLTLSPPPLPLPIHQLVLNDSDDDIGTILTKPVTRGNVEYIYYNDQDCLHVTSIGSSVPSISVPCVFTETSSFTISFWSYISDSMPAWYSPVGLNDGVNSVIMFGHTNNNVSPSILINLGTSLTNQVLGAGPNYNLIPSNMITGWNNFILTYSSGSYTLYINGEYITSAQFDNPFTTTELTIGENGKYTLWSFPQAEGSMYIRQVCVFDSVLSATNITNLYEQTQGNLLLTVPTDPLTPYRIRITNATYTSFTASWIGGTGATSYSYTLNGSPVTPSTQTNNSAIFTNLTSDTRYTVIVKAVNGSVEKASPPEIAETLKPIPVPTNQFVFQGVIADVGTNHTHAILTDPNSVIEYTNYSGKDCLHINSDGLIPNIKIPYVVSETSSFTISFWANIPSTPLWKIPVALSSGLSPIIWLAILDSNVYVSSGGVNSSAASTGITTGWNHFTITYSNKACYFYVNGELCFMLDLNITFTSTEISIAGNSNYGISTFGPTPCDTYIRQLCTFNAKFNDAQVANLYTLTQDNTSFIQQNEVVPYGIVISNVDLTSFAVSWSGGSAATSYSYTLNGSTVIPAIDNGLSSKSAIFTSLNPSTTYSLTITAGSSNSYPVSIRTRSPLPLPLSQFVFNDSANDVGIYPLEATTQGISFTNYSNKDCLYVNTDSVNASVTIPYVITDTDTFTISFWVHSSSTEIWNIPIGIDDGVKSIIEIGIFQNIIYALIGNSENYIEATIPPREWNHITITYTNTHFVVYINNNIPVNSNLVLPFTSQKINIGGNNAYTSWRFGAQSSCIAYIRQLCIFDSVLSQDQVSQLYTQTQGNIVLAPPLDPLTPYNIKITNIDFTSFTVSWSGATGATSYSFTVNGAPFTPSVNISAKTASFTGLIQATTYVLIIKSINVNNAAEKSSRAKTIHTKTPVPSPINQLIFDEKSEDIGTSASTITIIDPDNNISYTNYGGKDCIHIVSDGTNPKLTIPCVFTKVSPFTFSFWIKFDNVSSWSVPIALVGTNSLFMIGFDRYSIYLLFGNGGSSVFTQKNLMTIGSDFMNWTHITVTHINGVLQIYKNGIHESSLSFTQSFTLSNIHISGNANYQNIMLGGQVNWDGYIHQICVFNSVLNKDQIYQLYDKTQDNTILAPALPPITQEEVEQIQSSFTSVVTTQQGSSAITAALASNAGPNAIVAAALVNASPQMFTALVNHPAFVGTSVSIPATVAASLYVNFQDKTTLNTSLPLKVNFPAADGKVTPPTPGTNSKLAIDLTVNNYVPFRGCTGYGIYVIGGEQYFTTPSNSVGTLVSVGDIVRFTVDGGASMSFKVADLDIVLIPYTPPTVICFFGSAPVLTPNGYCRIDTLAFGDVVCTREGTAVIEKVEKQVYLPGPYTNPYVIPAGKFGAHGRILLSPRHKVAVDGQMIEARDLDLEQEEQYERITYYNIQVTNCENIIVAGLEVESLQTLTRINIPIETFNYIIANKYGGKISDEIKEKCYLMADGTMSVPMIV